MRRLIGIARLQGTFPELICCKLMDGIEKNPHSRHSQLLAIKKKKKKKKKN